MKIKTNPNIENFFSRCRYHLNHETKNEFIGLEVTPQNEAQIQQSMKTAGFQEFQGSKATWPSLFISTQSYLKSPYHSNIKLDFIQSKDFRLTKEVIPANELFNVSSIHPDLNRELNDWMTLRAIDQPYEATFLWQGKEVWMLDAPSEANTIDPVAKQASGNVLTFGCGIGYFIYMASLNPKVTSITVIEHSKTVIDLFEKYLLPQFHNTIPITLIEGDAFNFFDHEFMKDYDKVFVDIWKSNEDGYLIIERLLEQYLPIEQHVDFWIESSCFEFMPALIYLYFDALAHHKTVRHHEKTSQRTLKKIAKFFEAMDETIDSVDHLKEYMYNPKILRKIAAVKL